MDYKETYLQHYDMVLDDQEKAVKTILSHLRIEKRKYSYSSGKVGKMLLKSKEEFESIYSFDTLSHFVELYKTRKKLYSEDSLKLIFENELRELFEEKNPFEIQQYIVFLKQFARWNGLEDARFNFGAQNWLNELYFEYDEIEKISLRGLKGDIKEHKDFIRLSTKKFPEHTKFKIVEVVSPVKEKKKEIYPVIPILDNDEKLLLIHYLLHLNSLEKVEKIKILALIGTVPIDNSIFEQKSRQNNYYNKIRKGYDYYGKGKGREILMSLHKQVEFLKIAT